MIDGRELELESTEGGEDPAALEVPSVTDPEPLAPTSATNGRGHLKRLSIDDIVAADDLAEDIFDVPEWGGSVRIKAMTKQRQIEIREEGAGEKGLTELLMFVTCVIEPELTPDHVAVFRGKSAAVFDRIMRRILELNGANKEAVEQAKARFPAGSAPTV